MKGLLSRKLLLLLAACFILLLLGQLSDRVYLLDGPHEDHHKAQAARKPKSGSTSETSGAKTPVNTSSKKPGQVSGQTKEKSSTGKKKLSDTKYVPFQDAVTNEVLDGWEENWFSQGAYDVEKFGRLQEPKIDFVYTWANESEKALANTKRPYELKSPLNDKDGVWLASQGKNRYRDWDELRYSIRSVEKHAGSFLNKIFILVNSIHDGPEKKRKQKPTWFKQESEMVKLTSVEEIFDENKKKCLPIFNSRTIENQLFNAKSDVDRVFAISDDTFLNRPYSASDIYSPLFGPMLHFKDTSYNTKTKPTPEDALRPGEKPNLIYTSWLLNKRFGNRKRRSHQPTAHSLSRSLMKEALTSFPKAHSSSTCTRFPNEKPFQINPWYTTFHYTIERHREVLLWSYLTLRSAATNSPSLSYPERHKILEELAEGLQNSRNITYRTRAFYHVADSLSQAGLPPPLVPPSVTWTSLDGPLAIRNLDRSAFESPTDFLTPTCLGPEFLNPSVAAVSTDILLENLVRKDHSCGDCFLKALVHRRRSGLEPLLPPAVEGKAMERRVVLKALRRYSYTIADADALVVEMTDEGVVREVGKRLGEQGGLGGPGRGNGEGRRYRLFRLIDDVRSSDGWELERLKEALKEVLGALFPEKSSVEV